jgi:phosphoesterase RecJ-like protein
MIHEATSRLIYDKLMSAKKPILVSHRKPDGDTLGGMMAVYNHLKELGREATAFCVDVPATTYSYFPRIKEVRSDAGAFQDPEVDMVCVFDAGDLKYAGVDEHVAGMARKPFIINFDHHVTNLRFGDLNLVITDASSTAEVIHLFLRANGLEPDRRAAVCLMTGILTDTSNFSNPATTVKSLEIASHLLLKGASIHDITRRLMRNKPVHALKLWGLALERLRWEEGSRTASTALFLGDFKTHPVEDEHVEGLSNFLNHILETEVILVLKELPGGLIKGSYRSGKEADVAEMAKRYGGGGHKKAAGFTVAGKIVETPEGWKVEAGAIQ